MTLAFCLFNYFPHGGLQRDFLRIALECRRRGSSIRVYTLSWDGPVPEGFDVRIVPIKAFSNHRRAEKYFQWLEKELKKNPSSGTVGFNKGPGLDVYFAADSCFSTRRAKHRIFRRFLPRDRTYLKLEQSVFEKWLPTHILMIAPRQIDEFSCFYALDPSRYTLLPPGLNPDFHCADPQQARRAIRAEFALDENDFLLLQVGSSFKTKGVDRVIRALASLPELLRNRCVYLVAGEGNIKLYQRLAGQLGVSERVRFAGVRQDIPDLMAAADLLVHPARTEAAGMTLVESLASSLPVLCSGVCGYAPYIADASSGIVLPEPFSQAVLNRQLKDMLSGGELPRFEKNAREYVRLNTLSGMHERAAEIIMQRLNRV
jgi:UDP-glucose:(heptosyl)LPS alpha-1,3-glucosyltransferase